MTQTSSTPLTPPNAVTVEFVRASGALVIAEIGVFKGATSTALAEYLDNRGELHLFDFQENVDAVVARLRDAGYRNVVGHGNTRKLLDSYNWSLMKVLQEHDRPVFDYVYLDGAHTWAHDALAFLLVDRLLKPGGHVDFDDYEWTLAASPSVRPEVHPATAERYTSEQIETAQVRLVVDLLVRRDPRYREVVENKIFQKVAA